MCLAVPMEIVEINQDGSAITAIGDVRRKTNISLISNSQIGDYVIVHAGYAIEKLNREEAEKSIIAYRELAATFQPPPKT